MRALIVKKQEILFIHHAFKDPALFDTWTFPGGRLDPEDPDPVAALHREMREELSIEIEVLGELGRFYSRSGRDYTLFVVRPLDPIGPVQTDEIREFTWLTPAEVYEWHCDEKLLFGFEMEAVSAYLRRFK